MQKDLNEKALAVARERAATTKARLNSVDAACERLGVGRTLLYRALNPDPKYRRGLPHLKSVMLGGKRLISDEALELFIAELEREHSAERFIAEPEPEPSAERRMSTSQRGPRDGRR